MFNQNLQGDQLLLDRLKAGDEAAFTAIYQQYHRAVYGYLLSFVKVPALAEDLVHEVFMKIWEIRERLVITTSFSAYLYRISHNKAVDALKIISRDSALRKEVFLWMEPSSQTQLEREVSLTQEYEQLYLEAVSALAPQRQKVFILCREKCRTYDEAAAELGISKNTVKEHMVQSLRFLRAYLQEKGEMAMVIIMLGNIF